MTILVVEHSPVHRRGVANMIRLEEIGEVIEAATDEEAMACVTARHLDFVIISWMVGEADRLSLISAVKSGPRGDKLPVIVIMDRAFQSDVMEVLKTGADSLLLRPFSAEQLRERMETALLKRAP